MDFTVVFLIGFAGGLVGSLSSGGGLITIPLLLLMGHPPIPVIATTRIGSLAGSLTSLSSYTRKGFVHWKYVLSFAIPSLVAGIIGAKVLIGINQKYVATFVGVILLILSLILLFSKKYGVVAKVKRKHHAFLGTILVPIAMVYAVMFGAGGGLIVINILLACFGLVVADATATAMGIWVIGTASASVVYIISGNVLYMVLPALILGSALGGLIGAKVALKKDNEWLKRALGLIVLVSSLKMLFFN